MRLDYTIQFQVIGEKEPSFVRKGYAGTGSPVPFIPQIGSHAVVNGTRYYVLFAETEYFADGHTIVTVFLK